jgi:hypothetical protein
LPIRSGFFMASRSAGFLSILSKAGKGHHEAGGHPGLLVVLRFGTSQRIVGMTTVLMTIGSE